MWQGIVENGVVSQVQEHRHRHESDGKLVKGFKHGCDDFKF